MCKFCVHWYYLQKPAVTKTDKCKNRINSDIFTIYSACFIKKVLFKFLLFFYSRVCIIVVLKNKVTANYGYYRHRAYKGSTSHSLASVLRRGLPPPLATFNSHDEYFQGGVPLFSALAKPGVRIISENLNLRMLCAKGPITFANFVGIPIFFMDVNEQ